MLNMRFEHDGFVIVARVVEPARAARLAQRAGASGSRSGGTRRLLCEPWCAALARALHRDERLAQLIPVQHAAVQCTYFEKSAARNWLVPLHQDLSIPVARRVEHPALGGWSTKEGAPYVQPPPAVLEQLVAVRLHLDPCAADDGPLRVVPGSHRAGIVADDVASAARDDDIACTAGAGDALVMRPLLLHASSKATGASRRRVLHFVFGPPTLPHGLAWA